MWSNTLLSGHCCLQYFVVIKCSHIKDKHKRIWMGEPIVSSQLKFRLFISNKTGARQYTGPFWIYLLKFTLLAPFLHTFFFSLLLLGLPTRFIDALFGVHMFEFVMRYTSQQTSMIAISSLDFARIKAEPVYSLKAFGKVNASKTSAALKTAIIIVNSFAACTLSQWWNITKNKLLIDSLIIMCHRKPQQVHRSRFGDNILSVVCRVQLEERRIVHSSPYQEVTAATSEYKNFCSFIHTILLLYSSCSSGQAYRPNNLRWSHVCRQLTFNWVQIFVGVNVYLFALSRLIIHYPEIWERTVCDPVDTYRVIWCHRSLFHVIVRKKR